MASFRAAGQLVRQFSTSSVANKLVATPFPVYGIEGRYASALYSAASKQNKLAAVEKDLASLQSLLKTDKFLSDFMRNPTLKKAVKIAALETAFKKQKFSDLTINTFGAMVENGRLNKIEKFLALFSQIMSADRGEVICTVTTAKPLDSKTQQELKTTLNGFLKKGQILQLELKVDPDIMGGMVVNLADRFVDMSIASKIKTYSTLIKGAV